MKTLVLQLARLGDIYQTWPVLAALKRLHPDSELHLLTRAKFAAATEGLHVVDKHWLLDTRQVLSPLIDERPELDEAMRKLDELTEKLLDERFERVINLSFSPLSSLLTYEISRHAVEVRGYTRFDDGYLSIPDDPSAYFYAQVGVDKSNRLHVTDLFAHVADVELEERDWEVLPQHDEALSREKNVILIHVGASSEQKTLSVPKWQMVAKRLLARWSGRVVLIGSEGERTKAEQVAAISGERRPENLVGQTSLKELIALIREARLLIGGDSGPVQIASLVNTPVLNISLKAVSFWETGPRSKGSRILPVEDESQIGADEIVEEALALLESRRSNPDAVVVPLRNAPYVAGSRQENSFEWELLRALYMGAEMPAAPGEIFLMGLKRLGEVVELALEQIDAVEKNPGNKIAASIIEQSDVLMDQIMSFVPEVGPLVRWFRTEKIRIGPKPLKELIEATKDVYLKLQGVIAFYLTSENLMDADRSA